MCALACVACGKKGPPLPPLIRLPAAPDLRADRRGSAVDLALVVPGANADGTRPANIARVEVYAVTGSVASITDADFVKRGTRVASLAVKAPRDTNDTVEPGESQNDVEAPAGEGLDQGAATTVQEKLDASALVPADGGGASSRRTAASEPEGPLLGPSPAVPVRTYVGVGINTRGRKGRFSKRVAVPLAPAPPAPPSPTITYTETTITVAWASAPSTSPAASTSLPSISTTSTAATAADRDGGVLPAQPLGPPPPALGYNVYDSTTGTLLTTVPVAALQYTDARPIVWGTERCYTVRSVDKAGGLSVESEAREPGCKKPVDTFPPAAPKDLKAVSTEGVISLIWEANTESDLAGYIILRAPAPSEQLAPVVAAPVLETSFNDTVPPGVRFVYAVEAVDKAGNASAPSNRIEETAR
jgi:hypothetical protein